MLHSSGLRNILPTPPRLGLPGQSHPSDVGGAWVPPGLLPDHLGVVIVHCIHEFVRHLARSNEDLEPWLPSETLLKRDIEVAVDRARQLVAGQAPIVNEAFDLCRWSGSFLHLSLYRVSTSCWPARGK